jgi:hypothetical protein
MVGNAAARCAEDRREICDRALSGQQDLEHLKPGRIPENPEVPRPGRQSRTRRWNSTLRLD